MAASAILAACGSGGDDGPPRPPAPPTRFIGTLADPVADAGEGRAALRGATGVTVCVEGTAVCLPVRTDGSFVLEAAVGGDVALRFSGPDFEARLVLDDVPPGATVRIADIRCSLLSGRCSADGVEIDAPPANAAPICDGAFARPAMLWPPNHALRPIIVAGVVDPDGDRLLITVGDVFQDEPVDDAGDGSGRTAPDAGLRPPAVRAERSGGGNGRVYHLVFTASDGRGGLCTGTVEVCVPHDRRPDGACLDDGAQFDSLG